MKFLDKNNCAFQAIGNGQQPINFGGLDSQLFMQERLKLLHRFMNNSKTTQIPHPLDL